MTKSTGRGRGWRRKGTWEALAPSTQKRYQSSGVGKDQYERGARRDDYSRYIRDQERYYGRDAESVKDELSEYNKRAVVDAIVLQRHMQQAFMSGDVDAARRMWEARDQSLPEWMFYYHGAFS